jgi:hypothetical protein
MAKPEYTVAAGTVRRIPCRIFPWKQRHSHNTVVIGYSCQRGV